MDKEVTISRVLPCLMEQYQQDPKRFLKQLRSYIREARAAEPQLANYQLSDVGLIRKEQGVEVKMYFSEAN